MRVGLFPGQGISADVALEGLPERDPLIHEAREVLGYDLRKKVAIAARRAQASLPTSIAQPAIFLAGVIAWRSRAGGDGFDYLAGHSLGEYTALVAAESISFRDALGVVAVRGAAMQDASRENPGGMAAVLGLDLDLAQTIADKANVQVANDNAPGQVVLAGSDDGLAEAAGLVRSSGGRAVLLDVSGPFHTDAMAPAVPALRDALGRVELHPPRIAVVSNVTARPYGDVAEIRSLLADQVVTRSRFRESLEWLAGKGVDQFEDLGPGRVVAGLAQRTFSTLRKEKEAAGA